MGLDRRASVAALLAGRTNPAVVTGLGSPTYDVFAAGDNEKNFYLWGAMGGAALVGYGLARAQPSRPVIVITGDGEQFMGLGGLATIVLSKPANLSIVVLDNGCFGETGMQRSHSGYGVSLCDIAKACGFVSVSEITEDAGIERARDLIHKPVGGPHFFVVRILKEDKPKMLPSRDGVFLKIRLRNALGLSEI